jgi:putative Ca2+/H+ antiporter (TMEM165/GDT1 family)
MDWKVLGTAFVTVFLAELGDKTQLATLNLAAGSAARWAVFVGSALALVATSAIAVLGGEALARWVPALWLQRAAGVLFLALGLLFLLRPEAG